MKKLYYILSLLFLTTACDLSEKPYTINEDLGKDPTGAALIVTSMYNVFWSTQLMKKSYMECIDIDHDQSAAPTWVVSGAGDGNMTNHWSYNKPEDPFCAFYQLINRANFTLESLVNTQGLEEVVHKQYLGEAYFLRAFAYFHLVRMYGPVPLRLHSKDLGDRARSSVKTVYEQIISDLEAARIMKWATTPSNWGHANRTAAEILLAKVYATMGSGALAGKANIDVNIKGTLTHFATDAVAGYNEFNAMDCYTKVKNICDTIILRRGIDYDIKGAYKDIWGASNVRNNEFVWGITGNSRTEYVTEHLGYYYTAPTYYGRGWAGITEHAYSLFGEGDERGEHGIFHYVKQTYDNTSAYVRMPDNATKYPTGPDGKPARSVANYYYTYFITKWYTGSGDVVNPIPNTTSPGYSLQAQDISMIRFIELYLLRAEALNELGDQQGALNDLDVVRIRAKAELLSGTTSDIVDIRSLILQERGMEFIQEFNRKFDLMRWGLYLKVMNTTGTVRIQGTGLTISKVRAPRSVLYAVPLNEINNNELFGQNNEGW